MFLEHLISVFDQPPILKVDSEKGENSMHSADSYYNNDFLQAAIIALTAFFRSISSLALKSWFSGRKFKGASVSMF